MEQLSYNVEDVFTTEGVPKYTFITPPNFSNMLVDLRSPRKPIVFEGASGTGKTSAILTGLKRCGILNYAMFSSRVPNQLEEIDRIIETGLLPNLVTIVDDFHRLTDEKRNKLSDLVRAGADNPDAIGGKLIIAGINKAGQQLLVASEDLLKRIGIYRIPPAEPDTALKIMKEGAELLNINISNLEEIISDAKGDYWTIQKMCQTACIENGTTEKSDNHIEIVADISKIRKRIVNQLGVLYEGTIKEFVRGARFRKTNRPYLILLELFAKADTASISLNELANKYPIQKRRLEVIKKTRLTKLIDSKKLADKFYYDKKTTIFSVEDPGLSYYIQNLDWTEFSKTAGFIEEDGDWSYEVGLSFAGEQRDLASQLNEKLSEEDFTVFYDENEDLLGKDLENELNRVYSNECKYIIAIISEEYKSKTWPTFERNVWANKIKEGRIFPLFIEDVIIKEVSTSICRIDFHSYKNWKNCIINEAQYDEQLSIVLQRIQNTIEQR